VFQAAQRLHKRLTYAQKTLATVSRQTPLLRSLWVVLLDFFKVRRAVWIDADGFRVKVRTGTTDLSVVRTSLGGEFGGFASTVSPAFDGLIVDAGGYIGTFSLVLARMYPRATVIAVEASSENHAILRENIAPFPNIRSINAALIAPNGPDAIGLNDRGLGHWGLSIIGETEDSESRRTMMVETVTLQKLLAETGFDRISLLKLDIEGAELDLFRTADKPLEEAGIVIVELHDPIVAGCTDAFTAFSRDRFVYRDRGEKWLSVRRAGQSAPRAI
jgi:FkbM family methyltransferase